MSVLQARTLADLTPADWEQLARVDADPLHVAAMLHISEDAMACRLADAYERIVRRYSGRRDDPAMKGLLARANCLRSNFGMRLKAGK